MDKVLAMVENSGDKGLDLSQVATKPTAQEGTNHYSLQTAHLRRSIFAWAQQQRQRYLGVYYRYIDSEPQIPQSRWVTRTRVPNYSRSSGRR